MYVIIGIRVSFVLISHERQEATILNIDPVPLHGFVAHLNFVSQSSVSVRQSAVSQSISESAMSSSKYLPGINP